MLWKPVLFSEILLNITYSSSDLQYHQNPYSLSPSSCNTLWYCLPTNPIYTALRKITMCNTAKIYDFIIWGVARVWKVYNRSWLLLLNEFVSNILFFLWYQNIPLNMEMITVLNTKIERLPKDLLLYMAANIHKRQSENEKRENNGNPVWWRWTTYSKYIKVKDM